MRRVQWLACIGIVAAASFLLSACSPADQNVGILWTSEPSIASFVDEFNASQNEYRIMTNYHADPGGDLASTSDHPDLVIARYLTDQKTRRQFSSMNTLLSHNRIDRNAFYPSALAAGRWGNDQLFLPVSFDLPAVMFAKASLPDGESNFFMTLDRLQSIGATFNKLNSTGTRFDRVGFSPRWSTEFLYTAAALYKVGFHQEAPGRPGWKQENLSAMVDDFRNWIAMSNGGEALDGDFADRYLYNPATELVSDERVAFSFTTASQFLLTSDNKRSDLDLRWLSDGDRVPVMEGVVYAGIPSRPRHREAVTAFLEWFFRVQTQTHMLLVGDAGQVGSFGVANGLSTLKEVNEIAFPKRYPELLGHIPADFNLSFPPPVLRNWSEIRGQVVEPWLKSAITAASPPTPLLDRIRAWLLQQGE